MVRESFEAASLLVLVSAIGACSPKSKDTAAEQSKSEAVPVETASLNVWPKSLNPFGDGYPNAGDECRKVGESASTVNYLDDSATLVGCPSAEAAAALGGNVVATIDGITLVSIPAGDAMTGPAAALEPASIAPAQAEARSLTHEEIDAVVQRAMQTLGVPGVSIAVIQKGQPAYVNAYGVESLETNTPATPATLFGIGSVSKAFTTTAIAVLVDQGKLA